ncbi:MAG: alpha/beta fold hydrolase [Pseudomonadota bacterium]
MIKVLLIFLALSVVSVVVLVFGPRPEISNPVRFEALLIGPDIENYVTTTEARVSNLNPVAKKEIIWADPQAKEKTELSIVYIHGFSGNKMELRPVPDNVANGFDANIFFSRLTGHGRNAEAMAESTMLDWMRDLSEAITIGERLGERVVLMATSSGAALATYGMSDPNLSRNIAALVMVSPSYAIRGASIGLLNMPWGKTLLPLFMGRETRFAQTNDEMSSVWSEPYPIEAIFPLGAVMKAVSTIDVSEISTPALFVVSPDDKIISVQAVKNVFENWGGPKHFVEIPYSENPAQYLLPDENGNSITTAAMTEEIISWLEQNK